LLFIDETIVVSRVSFSSRKPRRRLISNLSEFYITGKIFIFCGVLYYITGNRAASSKPGNPRFERAEKEITGIIGD
jgi:hypothetical protein